MTKEKIGDLWRSPPEVVQTLHKEFNFVADMAASHENHLFETYFTQEDDALSFNWASTVTSIHSDAKYVWCNPPYSNPKPWILKAVEAQKNGLGVVMLLNYDHSVTWFREALKGVSEIRNIISDGEKINGSVSGRLAFIDDQGQPQNGNSKPQTVLVFNPFKIGTAHTLYVPKSHFYQQ